jgi:hypothetical protein
MESVKDFGAVGNGIADDTGAIQNALSSGRTNASADYSGLPKALYFPPGTYRVSNTLNWNGCCVTLQGAGSSTSIIELDPSSPGFSNAAVPKALISTPQGNESFRQNIWDMGFSIGAGNPGAIALSYIANNTGSIRDVQITNQDGKAKTGIDLTRQWAGPLLIKNVSVTGFQVGLDLNNAEYGPTFEDITLQSQGLYGIRNINQTISIRNLSSTNSVPAIFNQGGFITLIEASLNGGAQANAAVVTTSTFYLRDITSSGYGSTLNDESQTPAETVSGTITEHLVGTPQALASEPVPQSLNLNILETPTYTDGAVSTWAAFTPTSYGDTKELQPTLNSGASTVYFPFSTYFSYNQVTVTIPDTVQHLTGFSSIINDSAAGANGGGIVFEVNSNSTVPLIIDKFGYGLNVVHTGSRPVVIKDSQGTYSSGPSAGSLYLEDVNFTSLAVQPGQQVYARQLNIESPITKITNQGGTLWILGLKTENTGSIIETTQNGNTELLGALIYPARVVPASNIGFISTDSRVSYMYSQLVYSTSYGYTIQVQETRSGKTTQIPSSASKNFRMPLFVGY